MRCATIFQSLERQDPGVAKFGIALEWGSRGLEFESRHSDQKIQNSRSCSGFFLLWRDSNNQLRLFGEQSLAAGLDGGNTIIYRISTLGPKTGNYLHSFPFIFQRSDANVFLSRAATMAYASYHRLLDFQAISLPHQTATRGRSNPTTAPADSTSVRSPDGGSEALSVSADCRSFPECL